VRISFSKTPLPRSDFRSIAMLFYRLIVENQAEIDRILTEYGVPLLDEQGHLKTAP
jgi:hypothetical protein